MMGSRFVSKALAVLLVFLPSDVWSLDKDFMLESLKNALRRLPAFRDQSMDEIQSMDQFISPPVKFLKKRERPVGTNLRKKDFRPSLQVPPRPGIPVNILSPFPPAGDSNVVCGSQITEDAFLTEDLECDCLALFFLGQSPITLDEGANLNLNGFTVSCLEINALNACINVAGSGSVIQGGSVNNCLLGIVLQGTGNHVVRNIAMDGNFLSITSNAGSEKNQIFGNYIRNGGFNAISVTTAANVERNNIIDSTGSGIQVIGDNNNVRRNTIIGTNDSADPTLLGIGIFCSNADSNKITRNTIIDSERIGIILRASNDNAVRFNTVRSSGLEGINVGSINEFPSTGNDISFNTISSNGDAAIVDEIGPGENTYKANILIGNNPDKVEFRVDEAV